MANLTESLFNRFFKAGSPHMGKSFHDDMFRVPICHHAQNHRTSAPDEKTMDFTGMLFGGQFFYAEIKEHEGDDAIGFSAVSEHQQNMLDYSLAHGGQAMLGLGWTHEGQLEHAYLLPWKVVRAIQTMPLFDEERNQKRAWQSVTPGFLGNYFPQYELTARKISKTGRGTKIALFTTGEVQAHDAGQVHPNVPEHLPVPLPLDLYLKEN